MQVLHRGRDGRMAREIGGAAYKARTERSIGEAAHALERRGLADVRARLDALLAALSQHGDRLEDP